MRDDRLLALAQRRGNTLRRMKTVWSVRDFDSPRNAKRDGIAETKKDRHPVCPEGSTRFGRLFFSCVFPSRFDINRFHCSRSKTACGSIKAILTYPDNLSIAKPEN